MKKEKEQINFDLSKLTLQELVELYEKILEFLSFIEDKKIKEEEK